MAIATAGAVTVSGDALLDGLHQGSAWQLDADRTITYSLWNSGLGTWDASRAALVDFAFGLWEAVIDVEFVRVAPGGTAHDNTSDISLSFAAGSIFANGATAIGLFPDPGAASATLTAAGLDPVDFPTAAGDIYVDSSAGDDAFAAPGSVAFHTLLAQIGQAIGLKDPGVAVGGFGSFASLGVGTLDSGAMTVMSDELASATDAAGHPASPMMLDIAAAQAIYGVNATHNAGDSVYQLTTAGYRVTLWDTGGTDMLSAQGLPGDWTLSLEAGGVSFSTGNALSEQNRTVIAEGVEIEFAVGSSQDDAITGNDGDNRAWGLPGDDTILGGAGDDALNANPGQDSVDGGAGNDTIRAHLDDDTVIGGDGADVLFGGAGGDLVNGGVGNDQVNGNSGTDEVFGGDGTDTLRGQGGGDTVDGGNGDDLLVGHAGFDSLDGGAGNDTLIGGPGNDTLTGGIGDDLFVFGVDQGLDRITDFASGSDVMLVPVGGFGELEILSGTDGARVTWDAMTTVIVLNGIAPGAVDASDFIFS